MVRTTGRHGATIKSQAAGFPAVPSPCRTDPHVHPCSAVQPRTCIPQRTMYAYVVVCAGGPVLLPQFVVFEQFFDNMPGSPGRGGRQAGGSSSTSSSNSWGPGALSSLGHGRQTLHIIGSRAAAPGVSPGAADQWVGTMLGIGVSDLHGVTSWHLLSCNCCIH